MRDHQTPGIYFMNNRFVTMKGNDTIDNGLRGEWLQSRPGERFSIRIPASATDGAYSVTEILSSPGDSTPVHLHENEDEHILVLEGTARIKYGDKTFDAAAGTMVSLARGIPHAWGNPADTPLRFMITATPGGVEEVLRLLATSGEQLDVLALSDKYAVRLIGPPLLGAARRE